MINERYLYEIHPHRPIKNLIPGRAIVRPCSMKLTKSEVKICMNGGPVFRLFPGKNAIRVIGSNLDQLHVSKYEEYEKLTKASNQTLNDENCMRATEGVAEEPKTEAPTEVVAEEIAPVTETENIPEEYKNLVKEEFHEDSSLEDAICIIEEATKELKEESSEKMEELDTPDPEPTPVESEEVEKEETSVEESLEIPFEDVEEYSNEEVEVSEEDSSDNEDPQPIVNPVSINVGGGYYKKHKKNRH